jgi:hypothetical protein
MFKLLTYITTFISSNSILTNTDNISCNKIYKIKKLIKTIYYTYITDDVINTTQSIIYITDENNIDITDENNIDITDENNIDITDENNIDITDENNIDITDENNIDIDNGVERFYNTLDNLVDIAEYGGKYSINVFTETIIRTSSYVYDSVESIDDSMETIFNTLDNIADDIVDIVKYAINLNYFYNKIISLP